MQDPLVVKRGLSITREHEVVGLVTTNGTSVRLSHTPVHPGAGTQARRRCGERAGGDGEGGELDRLVLERGVVTDGIDARMSACLGPIVRILRRS